MFGTTFLLALFVGALMVSGLAYAVGEETVITMMPVAAFWSAFVLVMPLLVFVLIKRNHPVRFPLHARYLRRLKRGPFAGRAPVKRADSA